MLTVAYIVAYMLLGLLFCVGLCYQCGMPDANDVHEMELLTVAFLLWPLSFIIFFVANFARGLRGLIAYILQTLGKEG